MTADLVPVTDVAAIEALDPQTQEIAITRMLEESRTWLATAMATTDPTASSRFRVWIASVEQWTRRFGLAKEIQQDAQEMLRRAEYGMSRQILEGQERGEIETTNDARKRASHTRYHIEDTDMKARPSDFITSSEWHGGGSQPGIKAMTAFHSPVPR